MPVTKDVKRISRLRLTLPLGSPYQSGFLVSGEEEQRKLVSAGSGWTLSAAPSTASAYSQDSYTLSPVPFRSAKLDKRRFALALESAALEGGWSAPIRDPRSPDTGTFVLDLHSATLEPEDFPYNKSEEVLLKKVDDEEVKKSVDIIQEREHLLVETRKDIISKEASGRAKTQKPRTKSVFGKLFSRRSTQPSREAASEFLEDDNRPLLPTLPPRIEITVPSPGIKGFHDMPESDITPADMVKSLQSANIPGTRTTMPSGWKPPRPPSPIPKVLKKHGWNGHKRVGSSVSAVPTARSPVPPLPAMPREHPVPSASSMNLVPVADAAAETSPLVQGLNSKRSSWRESLHVRVKARAMKSAYYAAVPDDFLSPPSSAM